MTRRILLEHSRSGVPCIWEQGGGRTNTGYSILIADKYGKPLVPLTVTKKGTRACSLHALIPVQLGDYVVEVDWRYNHLLKKRIWEVKMGVIQAFEGPQAVLEDADYRQAHLRNFVEKAAAKSQTYHCRSAQYVRGHNAPSPKARSQQRPNANQTRRKIS